jgi:hypothetical protein
LNTTLRLINLCASRHAPGISISGANKSIDGGNLNFK